MVTIMGINDVPPAFEAPWTKENPFYTVSCLEEQPVGSIIGTIVANDDSGIDHYDIIPINPYINVNWTTGSLNIIDILKYTLVICNVN